MLLVDPEVATALAALTGPQLAALRAAAAAGLSTANQTAWDKLAVVDEKTGAYLLDQPFTDDQPWFTNINILRKFTSR